MFSEEHSNNQQDVIIVTTIHEVTMLTALSVFLAEHEHDNRSQKQFRHLTMKA